ncbi:MAG: hypothetical protein ABIK09_06645 [Pseudomonadota bacterium]
MSEAPRIAFEELGFRWTGTSSGPDDERLRIEAAHIPLHFWPSVRYVYEEDRQLGILERHLLRCLRDLERVSVEQAAQGMGVPAWVLDSAARCLVAAGAAQEISVGVLEADPEAVSQALEQERIPEERERQCGLLLFPHSSELVALDGGSRHRAAAAFKRIRPALSAPCPPSLSGRPVAELAAEIWRDGRAQGLPERFLRFQDERLAGPFPELHPAYLCSGHLMLSKEPAWLDLVLHGRRQRRQEMTEVEEHISLPAPPLLAQRWIQQTECLPSSPWRERALSALLERDAVTRPPLSTGPARYRWPLGEAVAQEVAARLDPTAPTALQVVDAEATVELTVDFEPAGDAAARVFAVEWVVRQARARARELDRTLLTVLLREARARYGVPGDAGGALGVDGIRSMLWERKAFAAVHRLREKEDLAYD